MRDFLTGRNIRFDTSKMMQMMQTNQTSPRGTANSQMLNEYLMRDSLRDGSLRQTDRETGDSMASLRSRTSMLAKGKLHALMAMQKYEAKQNTELH